MQDVFFAGITERFGKAVMEEVKSKGRARQKIPSSGKEYWLTQEVCDPSGHKALHGQAAR